MFTDELNIDLPQLLQPYTFVQTYIQTDHFLTGMRGKHK